MVTVSGLNMIEMAKAVSQADPPYEQIQALEEKLEPWVEFCRQIEGSEVGDAVYHLFHTVSSVSSAQEFGLALFMLEYLRQYFLEAKDSDWWAESIEMAEMDRLRDNRQYNPEFLNDEQKKTWQQRNSELPNLT